MVWHYYRLLAYKKIISGEISLYNKALKQGQILYKKSVLDELSEENLILLKIKFKKWPIMYEKLLERYQRKYWDVVQDVLKNKKNQYVFKLNKKQKTPKRSKMFIYNYSNHKSFWFIKRVRIKKIPKEFFLKVKCLKTRKKYWYSGMFLSNREDYFIKWQKKKRKKRNY